jgi:GNAT superfamily N-acetyltransferase
MPETISFERARGDALSRAVELLLAHNPDAVVQGDYYIATEDSEIEGLVGLLQRSWYLTELRHLYVKREFRRKGIGTLLVKKALKEVKTPLACCTVREGNEASLALFRHDGFIADRRFVNPETGHTVFLMVRPREF